MNQTMGMSDNYTEVFSWGTDQSGQLGLGSHPIGKTYPIPRYCTYNISIMQIACGDDHAAFITSKIEKTKLCVVNHLVYTMGSNHYGQLGIGDSIVRMKNSPVLVENLME